MSKGFVVGAFGARYKSRLLVTLDCKEAVAWVFVDRHVVRQISAFWALVLAEVKDSLFFAAAQNDVL